MVGLFPTSPVRTGVDVVALLDVLTGMLWTGSWLRRQPLSPSYVRVKRAARLRLARGR